MRLTLVRHAESTWNATGQWQGHADAPLSPRGHLQTRALAGRLFSVHFDRRICSDLSRAATTAAAIGEPSESDPRFREIDVGEWEGLKRTDVAERFPDQVRALRTGEPVRIGGGESMPEFQARVDAALDDLRAAYAGEEVLLVTHGGVIRAIAARVLGTRERTSPLVGVSNTSITRVRDDGGRLVLERYNDGLHLDGGDQDSALHQLALPTARMALVAADPSADRNRARADAILSGLGIAQYYALGQAQDSALTEALVADPLASLDLDQLRADHIDGALGLALVPARVPEVLAHLLELEHPTGLAVPDHGSVAQLRLYDERAELFSFGLAMGGDVPLA